MQDFYDRRDAAYAEHRARYSCEHVENSVRRRTIKGGSVQYVRQCLRCGEPIGNPIAKAKAIEENNGHEPQPLDESLMQGWRDARDQASEQIRSRFDRSAFLNEYSEYLESPAWARKRALVLKRANGLCEGCGEKPATQVHHLTYRHVCNEFLFELVAVCSPCHDSLHEEH
jgi:5-methylcytosine-specific restriction endonuclease McrA